MGYVQCVNSALTDIQMQQEKYPRIIMYARLSCVTSHLVQHKECRAGCYVFLPHDFEYANQIN